MLNFWVTGLCIIIGSLIAEIVWNKMGRKRFVSMTVVFTIYIVSLYVAVAFPLLFLTEMSFSALAQYEELDIGSLLLPKWEILSLHYKL